MLHVDTVQALEMDLISLHTNSPTLFTVTAKFSAEQTHNNNF